MTIRRTSLCLSMLFLLVLCFALLPAQALAAGDFDTPRELEVLEESPAMLGNGAGTITASTLYLKPNSNWTGDGARFAMYVSNSVTNAYAWADMSAAGDGYYSAAVPTGSWTNVMFARMNPSTIENTGDNIWNQTSDLCPDSGTNCYTIADDAWSGDGSWSAYGNSPGEPSSESSDEPGTEEPGGDQHEGSSFYLVGSMTDWQADDAYLLTKNEEAETAEYVLQAVELSKDDEFYILEVNGSILGFEPVFYPAGFDNNYVVTADGTYNVYFRPNYDGGAGWFEGCIYLVESEQGPQTPDIYVLAGTDNFIPSGWNLGQDSPVMTEGDDGIYSCTVENVENAQYQFKVVQLPGDDSFPIWHGLDGGDQNVAFSLSETCDVTVTYDPDTGEITVSGDGVIEPSTQLSAIYAVGEGKNGFLNNVSWNPAAEANLMTEVADGVYQITYYEIDTDETDPYEFKFAANGDLAVNWGIGSWDVYDVYEADAVLNEDLIYNAGSILFSLENCEDDYVDVTLVLDLSQWDADTQTGAKFSIIVGSEPATEQPTEQPGDTITVYFTDSLYWGSVGSVNCYYWNGGPDYPGTAMTSCGTNDYGDTIYSAVIPSSVSGIIFNGSGNQTVDITAGIADGAMWYTTREMESNQYKVGRTTYTPDEPPSEEPTEQPTEPLTEQPTQQPGEEPQTEAYYLIGTMTGWDSDDAYVLSPVDGFDGQYAIYGVALTTDSQFKVVMVYDGEQYWFPDGMGNNYGENGEIQAAGTYNVYFRPNYDGGDDWFYNCIYVDGPLDGPTEEPTEEPSEEPTEPVFDDPDFTLPKDIKSIEASAFEGADMSVVYIPDGCESIGANAFRYCANLRQIRIPASVTTIDQTAFTGCEDVVVFGAENSRAQEIADYYHFTFIAENS